MCGGMIIMITTIIIRRRTSMCRCRIRNVHRRHDTNNVNVPNLSRVAHYCWYPHHSYP